MPAPEILRASMLPRGAAFHEYCTQQATLDHFHALTPEEQVLVKSAVDKRKSEFGDGRWCAHEAMKKIAGPADQPILKGERGMPQFPRLISGSITHTAGYRAAVVSPALLVRSLGIDAEPAEPLPIGVAEHISLDTERRRFGALNEDLGITCADRLLFCCKETTYKAWFPLTHRFLDFDEAEIEIRADGTFTSHILARPRPMPSIDGHWVIAHGFIVTVAAVC